MLESILKQVAEGNMSPDDAKKELATFENLGFAKIDHHRPKRQGFPEVIFGEGKTASQIIAIAQSMKKRNENILATRIDADKAREICSVLPEFEYDKTSRTLVLKHKEVKEKGAGFIAVVCAGTSDLPIAEEAAKTLEAFDIEVRRFYDVGVAGIHRLLNEIEEIQNAVASIVVAGMEGALPSVVGGLVSHPVIAVPTSVGYGANFNGLSALLTMLNSCAAGISVVNIDNGFGGAYNAALIHRLVKTKVENNH